MIGKRVYGYIAFDSYCPIRLPYLHQSIVVNRAMATTVLTFVWMPDLEKGIDKIEELIFCVEGYI